ncbi:hypothetical protein NDA12_000770 [Ustilago hordei]|nr:hypothetical protein NDA15_005116 [Ustilago hordei]KAJ1591543.1 hypothetical protein NDA12_000770 [Ustilago hordei]
MAASTEGALCSPQVRSPSVTALFMGPPTCAKASPRSPATQASTPLRSKPSKLSHLPPTPCVDVICCDADYSVMPVHCTGSDCLDCPASAPASPCSDIHHISSACTEPTCAAATSSTSAVVCSTAVACCDGNTCPDVPSSPCSQAHCSASSMTLALPTIAATCCTDEACDQSELSPRLKAKVATICDCVVPPTSHTDSQAHAKAHSHRSQHNECRQCSGSITSVNAAEGGQLYSSFQELLDLCCCSMPPTVEQCCMGGQGSTAYACNTGAPHPLPAEQQQLSPAAHSSHQHHIQHQHGSSLQPHYHQHHQHHSHHTQPPLSDTPSSSIITSGGHYRDDPHSRASTVSTIATPQPGIASPATSSFSWSSAVMHSTSSQSKDKYHSSDTSSFDPSGAVSFKDIFPGLQSWNDCMFEQPHLHSSHRGCLPPAMTLCNSEICETSAPHSHWMPSSYTHQTNAVQSTLNHHNGHNGQQGDARPQQCQWGGCNQRFWTVEELVAHVNHSHLARKNAATAAAETVDTPAEKSFLQETEHESMQLQHMPTGLQQGTTEASNSLECLWKDCHQVPLPEKLVLDAILTPTTAPEVWKHDGAGVQGQNDKISLAILQHLLHDHLGQHFTRPFLLKSGNQHLNARTSSAYHSSAVTLVSPSTETIPSWTSKKRKNSEATSTTTSTTTTSSSSSATEPLFCRWENCSSSFDSYSALTGHIESAHVGCGKGEYECRWLGCARHASGQKFSQKQKVLRHIQTHTGDRPFKCAECGKRFSEQNTLAQHMRTHTLEKPYVCDHPGCGKGFSVAGSLTIHKRMHTGSKPFLCSFPGCGKAFAESSNLTKHARIHTGDKPFHCPQCGKRFSRPDQVRRHSKCHERKSAGVS